MYVLDGVVVTADVYLQAFPEHKIMTGTPYNPAPVPGIAVDWKKPVISYGAACHPRAIKDFENFTAAAGVPTDFTTKRGRPIFRSAAHKAKVTKLLRIHDNGTAADKESKAKVHLPKK